MHSKQEASGSPNAKSPNNMDCTSPSLEKMSIKFLGGFEGNNRQTDDIIRIDNLIQPATSFADCEHPQQISNGTSGSSDDSQDSPAPQRPWSFKIPKNKPKNGAFKVRWMQRYNELKEFKENFGHVSVTRVTKDYQQLGNWVADQRRKFRKGKLTEEQFHLLNDLGMEWDRSYYFKPTVFDDIQNGRTTNTQH